MNDLNDTRDEPTPATTPGGGEGPPDSPAGRAPPRLGAYQLLARLGQGGMGTVYKAWHTRLKRHVALKTLRAEYLENAPAVARFHREMELIGKLDHPNLIRANDAGEAQGVHYLVMELVDGLDAARLTQRHGPLTVADACELIRQAAVGLQCAHRHGLVHRDVKPSNLMVTAAGQVKVLDLGLARLYAGADAEELTESGQWMGTADFMAPEQGRDARHVDVRADVYSLGCTLYKLLSGHPPFGGPKYATPYQKMEAHAHAPVPPIRDCRPDVPAELAAVLERLLAKQPAERYPTPEEVAVALGPFTAGAALAQLVAAAPAVRPPAGQPEPPPECVETRPYAPPALVTLHGEPPPPGPRTTRRRWPRGRLVAAAALLLATAAVVGGLAAWVRRQPGPPVESAVGLPARDVWQNLLDQPPQPLLWPAGDVHPGFEKGRQRLSVNCEGLGLLRLGAAPPGTSYQLQVGFRQTPWTGGIGVFFGYHAEATASAPAGFQQVMLMPPPPPTGRFTLVRSRAALGLATDGSPRASLEDLYSAEVHRPNPHEYILELDVEKTGVLRDVRWDGEKLAVLTRPAAPGVPGPNQADGLFGIAVSKGSAVITTARWLVYGQE